MTQQRTSSIPTVKGAIVDLFTTTLATAGRTGGKVQVGYGEAEQPEQERVEVGGTLPPTEQNWTALGNRRRDENYALHVLITVDAGDTTQRAATERAFALLALLETALRADPTIGIAAQFEHLLIEVDQPELAFEAPNGDHEGFTAQVGWAIKVTARI